MALCAGQAFGPRVPLLALTPLWPFRPLQPLSLRLIVHSADLAHKLFRLRLRLHVIHDHVRALGRKPQRNAPPHPLGPASNQRHLPVQRLPRHPRSLLSERAELSERVAIQPHVNTLQAFHARRSFSAADRDEAARNAQSVSFVLSASSICNMCSRARFPFMCNVLHGPPALRVSWITPLIPIRGLG